jgi:probable glucitol transport protein GutA
MEKTEKPAMQSTTAERVSYGLYFLGQNIFFMLLTYFMLPFCTDIGIPATVVGTILLAVRIFDAANDPVFGSIVDRSHLKSGKFIPWLRLSLIFIPVFTVLLFATPAQLPQAMKIAWAAAAYTFWSMSYTVCDVPVFGIITALTSEGHERTTLISIGRVCAMIGGLAAMVTLPIVRQMIGGWLPTTVALSVIAFITMAPLCFIAKERVPPPPSQGEITAKALFTFVFKNKYLLIFYGSMILALGCNIANSLGMYIARYNLQDERQMALLSLLAFIPGVLMGALIPMITRRKDKYLVLMSCVIATIALNIISYFIGYNNILPFMVMLFIKNITFGGINMFLFMFTPDFAEYGMYKTGTSAFGVAFSIQTFSVKFMGAISGALAAAGLSLIGFMEGEGAAQAAGFAEKLWTLSFIVPTAALAAAVLVLLTYKLRDKHVAVMARCNRGEINREEAERLIGGKL